MVSLDQFIDNLEKRVHAFHNQALFIETFRDILGKYDFKTIETKTSEAIEKEIIPEIRSTEIVKEFHKEILESKKEGKIVLEQMIGIITDKMVQEGIIPKSVPKKYVEVAAICKCSNSVVARSLFEKRTPVTKMIFLPENTLYATNLREIYTKKGLTCSDCKNTTFQLKPISSGLIIDNPPNNQLKELLVNQVIINTGREYFKGKMGYKDWNRQYSDAKSLVLKILSPVFDSIGTSKNPNYLGLYDIFTWEGRANFTLDEFKNFRESGVDSNKFLEILKKEISEVIPQPHIAIRSSVKDDEVGGYESLAYKLLRVGYNILTEEETGREKKEKHINDRFRARFIIGIEQDQEPIIKIKKIEKIIKNVNSWKHLQEHEKDYLSKPKKNKYNSCDLVVELGVVGYEFQIRTHEMDRNITLTKDPSLLHSSRRKYMEDLVRNCVHTNIITIIHAMIDPNYDSKNSLRAKMTYAP